MARRFAPPMPTCSAIRTARSNVLLPDSAQLLQQRRALNRRPLARAKRQSPQRSGRNRRITTSSEAAAENAPQGKAYMPLNSAQLADLVNRARHKAPVVNLQQLVPVAHRAGSAAQATPAPQAASPAKPSSGGEKPQTEEPVIATTASAAPAVSAPQSEQVAEVEDFPTGWELRKESWHFHRRFYAIFKRPMHRGEYSQLLSQIRRGTAKHLWEDCWQVTLPGSIRTLPVRATRWRLITILPKNWQPPA
jgi:hypothetical protein